MLLFAHWRRAPSSSSARRRRRGPAQHHQQQQYKRRASAAVAEMLWLITQIPRFSCFKVHPFLPDPLGSCHRFL
jgi:hypothetical protein